MDEHNSVTLMAVTEVVMSGFNSTYNGTDDTDFEPGDPFRHPLYMRVIYSVAYITIMIMAVVGNVMVVAVVYRNQSMHSVTNYFIVNLAIADIMVAVICLPMTLLFNLYKGKTSFVVLKYFITRYGRRWGYSDLWL